MVILGAIKTKAFTLIELLAIIVILAIIAVITVPIILGVIDNAKRGSVIDSAYGYKDAINKYYVTKLSEDSSFKFEDGTYLVSELKIMGLAVSGNEPTADSWVIIKDNQVYDFSLKFGDYVVNYDVDTKKVSAIKNGTVELTPEAQAEQDRINNIKQIITAYIEEAKTKNSSLESETVKSVSDMTDVVMENGPVEGWIHFDVTDDGVVIKDYSLKVDNYIADYSEDITVTKDGTIRTMPIVRTVVRTIDSVDYYNTEWIGANPVYYNPTDGAKCNNYHEDNSKTGYNGVGGTDNQTSCLKWYAYSEQNGNVNLLLDHNTTPKLAWVSSSDYNKSYDAENGAQSLGITYPNDTIAGTDSYGQYGNWNKGPITLLNQLKTDTSGWTGISNRTDSYTNKNSSNYSGTVTERYTINYSEYKARIITSQEIANIVGFNSWNEETSSNIYYLDNHEQSSPSTRAYGWLYDRTSDDCTQYGCLNNSDVYTIGYWTVSPDAGFSGYTASVWSLIYSGTVNHGGCVAEGDSRGLRPVITVSKSSIFES